MQLWSFPMTTVVSELRQFWCSITRSTGRNACLPQKVPRYEEAHSSNCRVRNSSCALLQVKSARLMSLEGRSASPKDASCCMARFCSLHPWHGRHEMWPEHSDGWHHNLEQRSLTRPSWLQSKKHRPTR